MGSKHGKTPEAFFIFMGISVAIAPPARCYAIANLLERYTLLARKVANRRGKRSTTNYQQIKHSQSQNQHLLSFEYQP